MIRNIISLALLIVSVTLSITHGWETFNYKSNPGSVKMMGILGISETFIPFVAIYTIMVGVLILIPQTYFLGNLLNAVSIVIIMCLAVRAGNFKMVLIELPFLAMPLIMIWLKYPFKIK